MHLADCPKYKVGAGDHIKFSCWPSFVLKLPKTYKNEWATSKYPKYTDTKAPLLSCHQCRDLYSLLPLGSQSVVNLLVL